MEVKYHEYTTQELEDVRANINKDKYPERYQAVVDELSTRKPKKVDSFELKDEEIASPKPKRKRSNKARVISNSIFIAIAVSCIYFERIPGRNGGITLVDSPYWFWSVIVLCFGLCLVDLSKIENNDK